MVDFGTFLRRDILMKIVECTFAVLIIGLISGHLESTNSHKTEVIHGTIFICIAISIVTVASSLLDCPVDERLLMATTLAEALLFVVTGGLLMEGFNASSYKWSGANLIVTWGSSKGADWQVMGAGVVAFITALIHVFDLYILFHVCHSPNRPSLAVKKRFNGAGDSAA